MFAYLDWKYFRFLHFSFGRVPYQLSDQVIVNLFIMQAVEEMEWNLPTDVQVSLFKTEPVTYVRAVIGTFIKYPCIVLSWKHNKVRNVTEVFFWSFTRNYLFHYLHKRNQG